MHDNLISRLSDRCDRLGKQNKIMRKALKRISELALTRSTDAGGIRDQECRWEMDRVAHDALKEAEEVE